MLDPVPLLMSRALRSLVAVLALVLVAGPALAACGSSDDGAAGASSTLRVVDVTVDRPSNPDLTAVRLVIDNGAAEPDTLLAVSSPVATDATLHRSTEDDQGLSTMERIDELPVAARSKVTFAVGGLHVMLEGLTRTLAEGDTVPLTFTFANAGKVTVDATVTPPGGAPEEHDHD